MSPSLGKIENHAVNGYKSQYLIVSLLTTLNLSCFFHNTTKVILKDQLYSEYSTVVQRLMLKCEATEEKNSCSLGRKVKKEF